MFNPELYIFNFFGLPVLLSGLTILMIGVAAYIVIRKTDPNIYFLFLCISLFIWVTGSSISYFGTEDMQVRLWYRYYALLGLCWVGPSAYFAVLTSTRSLNVHKVYVATMYVFGVMIYGMNIKYNFISHGVRQMGPLLYPQFSATSYPFLIFFFPFIVGVIIHLALRFKGLKAGIERDKNLSLLGGYLTISLAAVDFLPTYGIPIFPFGYIPLLIGMTILTYVSWRYRQALITPEIASDEIINLIPDFLVLIDRGGEYPADQPSRQ